MATTYTVRYDTDFVVETSCSETAQWESEHGARVTATTEADA